MPSVPRALGFGEYLSSDSGAGARQREAAAMQMRIAKELFDSTATLRNTGINSLQNFLLTGNIPTGLQMGFDRQYDVGRAGMEDQFNVARERLLSSSPVRGGQLNDQLAQLEMQRAGAVGNLAAERERQINAVLPGLFSSAVSTGFGSVPQTIAGLESAAGQFGNSSARDAGIALQREKMSKEVFMSLLNSAGKGVGAAT